MKTGSFKVFYLNNEQDVLDGEVDLKCLNSPLRLNQIEHAFIIMLLLDFMDYTLMITSCSQKWFRLRPFLGSTY